MPQPLESNPSYNHIDNAETGDDGLIERPVIILQNQVVFPGVLAPISIETPEASEAARRAIKAGHTIITVARRNYVDNTPLVEQLYTIGTEVAVGRIPNAPKDLDTIMAQGRRRIALVEITQTAPIIMARARPLDDITIDPARIEGLTQAVIDLFKHSVETQGSLPEEVIEYIENAETPGLLCDLITSTLNLALPDRQSILDQLDIEERLKRLALLLGKELSYLEMREEINAQVQDEMARGQREMYLREQLRIIQDELGEEDFFQQEMSEVRDQIDQANLPPLAYEQAMKELSRLAIMPPMAPEVGIIRTYLDWLTAIPWNDESEDNLDIAHAQATLEADHHGLPIVKERILEHIAVRRLAADKMKSPILCFVGPPGVGKTSLGKSIARSLNREFVRMSLGGVRDEAEIRGHRRTYIGAMPGRIIQTIRRAGKCNPIFMLDEIDKLSADYRGDPSAALLEALDPEQNNDFTDHYLEVPFDLSKVMFITTANDLSTISEALADRMEVIEFSGYTEEEKIQIARRFLIPKTLEAHGLMEGALSFETRALQIIIREYTYEAGVRNLEREIAKVCRKIARLVAQDKKHPKRITPRRIYDMLGPPMFATTRINKEDSVGLVTGLVWTPGGGDVQTIEVSILPGKGNLTMTGQLGDVLQESGQTAMSYMRSRANDMDIPHDDFENYDVHVHMPEGAVPKEGPSAGITLAIAIISSFTERKVRSDYAMTGEITLRGKVLPVGGIKEKVLASRRNLIQNIILPADNEKDLTDIPKEMLKGLNIHFVEDMQQVMDLVLLDAPEQRQRDLDNEDDDDNYDDDMDDEAETSQPRPKAVQS